MKLNWGLLIVIVIACFVTMISILVISSVRQDFDLVTKDYYAEELKYQKVLDAGKNQAALSAPVQIVKEGSDVNLTFPSEFIGKQLSGTLQFFSMEHESWDKTYTIDIQDAKASVSIADIHPAKYTIKLNWSDDDKPYYQETELNVQ